MESIETSDKKANAKGAWPHLTINIPSSSSEIAKLVKQLKLIQKKSNALQQNYARQIADCAEMRQAILREAFEGRL